VTTLIFLALETRRARDATQQSNRQARQRIRTDLSLAIAVNPQLTELMAKTFAKFDLDLEGVPPASEFGISEAEGIQFYNYSVAYIRYLEDQFFSDLPDTDRFSIEGQVKAIYRNPYFAKFWEESKSMFDPRFHEYVENLSL
jgi:hypothetical protein